jgi:hypothetical protein
MKPPKGTRLILANENLLDMWGTRNEDGYRITAEWGEPDKNGWYTPFFGIDFTDRLPIGECAPDFGED